MAEGAALKKEISESLEEEDLLKYLDSVKGIRSCIQSSLAKLEAQDMLRKRLREVPFAKDLRTSVATLKALQNVLQKLEAIDVAVEVDSLEEIIIRKLPSTR
uniref:Biogenesis of lysosome-related organelles complex 1 subunit 7 n=1 Tax=Syphacia muris TaxID=451379 RepID=A0A0N5AZV9_9BILA